MSDQTTLAFPIPEPEPTSSVDLRHGDCLEVLRDLQDNSVDSVVTSPPYAMQRKTTYGGVPEKDYPEWTVAWMREVWRVLKDDGSVIINISPHIKNGELSDYVLRTRLALRDAGWVELPELIWHKKCSMPTGAPDRPRRTWESLLWFGKHGRALGNPKANGKALTRWIGHDTGQASHNGWEHTWAGTFKRPDIARCTDVYSSNINQVSTGHPASFPVGLAEWCGKLITPDGGTILDPFTGSSSTGVAAIRNGWNFIGIDQSAEYIEMSNRRLSAELAKAAERGGR